MRVVSKHQDIGIILINGYISTKTTVQNYAARVFYIRCRKKNYMYKRKRLEKLSLKYLLMTPIRSNVNRNGIIDETAERG